MELASICVFLLFTVIIIFNYHKAVLILGPMGILFQPYMCLRYNSPAISLTFILQLVIISVLIIKNRKLKFRSFPLNKAYVFLFLSLFVGLIVSPHSKLSLLPWLLSQVISYLFVVVYYNELKSLSDIKLSLKSLIFAAILLLSYFVFELLTQTNPIIQSMFDLLGMDNGWVYPITERYGMIRTQSFMTICIGWGGFCCLLLVALFVMKYKSIFPRINFLILCMAILALLGVFFCGSRSVYVFLMILVCYMFFHFKGRNKVVLYFFAIILGIMLLPYIYTFVIDIIETDAEGSSVSMRQMQFLATFSALSESLLCGFGVKGYELAIAKDADILGAESIWLQQLINYGLIGVVMQLYLYTSCWRFIVKYGDNSIVCKFMLLGWILFCTMTTSPGLPETYFMIILLLLCKTFYFSRPQSYLSYNMMN